MPRSDSRCTLSASGPFFAGESRWKGSHSAQNHRESSLPWLDLRESDCSGDSLGLGTFSANRLHHYHERGLSSEDDGFMATPTTGATWTFKSPVM